MKSPHPDQLNPPFIGQWMWFSLIPVISLFVLGCWLISQEHRMAKQEAQDDLEVSTKLLIEYLESETPLFPWAKGWSGVTESNVVGQHILFIPVNASGECLLQPLVKVAPLPVPETLPWQLLNESQMFLWQDIIATKDFGLSDQAVAKFHQSNPREPFYSLAEFKRIASMVAVGGVLYHSMFDSIDQLRSQLLGNIKTESGLPLAVALDFLEVEIIKRALFEDKDHISHFWPFAARQVNVPSSWSHQLLRYCMLPHAEDNDLFHLSLMSIWILEQRELARRFHASLKVEQWAEWAYLNSTNQDWIYFENEDYFLLRASQNENSDFLAIPMEWLKLQFGKKLADWRKFRAPPETFHFSVELKGSSVFNTAEESSQVKLSSKDSPSINFAYSSINFPWFKVGAVVSNPDYYFTSSKKRTRQMISLMSLAGFTGLVGLFAQWRAFRRQVALSKMKSNFVASVSHELRAPIASIRLMAENLSKQKENGESERKDYFDWIGLECRRLSSLVQNILQFSRLELGKREYSFESVDVLSLFDETLKIMEPLATNAQVNLKSEIKNGTSFIDREFPEVFWDGQAIHQALVNLLDNAIKHTPKEGTICAELMASDNRNTIEFRVVDQGPGIKTSDRERIFQPFERLGSEMTRKTKGVGIGLNLVWHTAKAHEGNVRVETGVKGGSCFVLSLPIHPKQS